MARRRPWIARTQNARRRYTITIQQSAVLAAQIAQEPFFAIALECQMLARESGIVREWQDGACGPTQSNALALQLDGLGLAVGRMDPEFPGASGGHMALVYLKLRGRAHRARYLQKRTSARCCAMVRALARGVNCRGEYR